MDRVRGGRKERMKAEGMKDKSSSRERDCGTRAWFVGVSRMGIVSVEDEDIVDVNRVRARESSPRDT